MGLKLVEHKALTEATLTNQQTTLATNKTRGQAKRPTTYARTLTGANESTYARILT